MAFRIARIGFTRTVTLRGVGGAACTAKNDCATKGDLCCDGRGCAQWRALPCVRNAVGLRHEGRDGAEVQADVDLARRGAARRSVYAGATTLPGVEGGACTAKNDCATKAIRRRRPRLRVVEGLPSVRNAVGLRHEGRDGSDVQAGVDLARRGAARRIGLRGCGHVAKCGGRGVHSQEWLCYQRRSVLGSTWLQSGGGLPRGGNASGLRQIAPDDPSYKLRTKRGKSRATTGPRAERDCRSTRAIGDFRVRDAIYNARSCKKRSYRGGVGAPAGCGRWLAAARARRASDTSV